MRCGNRSKDLGNLNYSYQLLPFTIPFVEPDRSEALKVCSLNWSTYPYFPWRGLALFSSLSVVMLGSTFSCLLFSIYCNSGLGLSPSLIQRGACVSVVR